MNDITFDNTNVFGHDFAMILHNGHYFLHVYN